MRHEGSRATRVRLAAAAGLAGTALAVMVGVATPALACHTATHTAHCYGSGVYGSNRYGVQTTQLIRNNTIVSGFSAHFGFVWVDGNNWMASGYIKGVSVVGSSTVPKGYSDWMAGGVYSNSGFVCTPSVGTYQEFIVNREPQSNVWHAHICGVGRNNQRNLGAATGVGYVQTEIIDNSNGCRTRFNQIHYENAVNGSWLYWPSLSTFKAPNDSTNPITTNKIDNHTLRTCE